MVPGRPAHSLGAKAMGRLEVMDPVIGLPLRLWYGQARKNRARQEPGRGYIWRSAK